MGAAPVNRNRHIHVVGAGIAGISAAMHGIKAGYRVSLYERSNLVGGRCRSYLDKQLNQLIDNGNHLMMSGNADILTLLDWAGARDRLHIADSATYKFADTATGDTWSIDIEQGRWPGWLLKPSRRVPGTGIWDYRGLIGILLDLGNRPLGAHLDPNSLLYHRFWEPLILAVMNIPADQADTGLFRQVLIETVMRGGAYSRPMIARHGLGPDLVDPCIDWLGQHNARVQYRKVLNSVRRKQDHVTGLDFKDGTSIDLANGDALVLAIPPGDAVDFLPDMPLPAEGEPILNLHYAIAGLEPSVLSDFPVIGLVGSLAQWVFLRAGLASVTVSAARNLPVADDVLLAARVWREIAPILHQPTDPVPMHRIICEKRATFTQTPANVGKRPASQTGWRNLCLAGDWTNTGLPATIEGAARSGRLAIEAVSRGAR
jgi:hydroxysqualene dehydroxylase